MVRKYNYSPSWKLYAHCTPFSGRPSISFLNFARHWTIKSTRWGCSIRSQTQLDFCLPLGNLLHPTTYIHCLNTNPISIKGWSWWWLKLWAPCTVLWTALMSCTTPRYIEHFEDSSKGRQTLSEQFQFAMPTEYTTKKPSLNTSESVNR